MLGALAITAPALLLAVVGCDSPDSPPPSVTAQGFDLGEARESVFGEPVVGLSRRVWSKTDVTLDFGPYVGQKMSAAGDYAFELEVTDREAQTTGATLRIRLLEPELEEVTEDDAAASEAPSEAGGDTPSASLDPLRSGDFRLERVGPGPVVSGDGFGITWKTIESNQVVIRVVGTEETASRFARLEPGAFAQIETRTQLAGALDRVGLEPSMELAMANNAASGTEIAIVQAKDRYLLRADRSETRLSELGTTVTLTGRYKR
jgi:hypothetical protein